MLDTNNNGYIDYTEFLAGCMKSKIYLNEDHLKIAFTYFDKVTISAVIFTLTLSLSYLFNIGREWLHYKGRVEEDT